MKAQRSLRLATQSHLYPGRPHWLSIIIIIAVSISTLISFISATFLGIGPIHNKLSETLGAIFTALDILFGFIALVLAIPPLSQDLQKRRSVSSPISARRPKVGPTLGASTTTEHQTYFAYNLTNTELSGTFLHPMKIGVNEKTSFNQPGYVVNGNITQEGGDVNVIADNAQQSSILLTQGSYWFCLNFLLSCRALLGK